MSSANSLTQLTDIVRTALKMCGLADANIRKEPDGQEAFLARGDDGYKACVDAFFRFEFNMRRFEDPSETVEEVRRAMKPLYDSLSKSELVRGLEDQVAKQAKQIESLLPYKTHYELEYQLRQGKR